MHRKDVMFFINTDDKAEMQREIDNMKLHDESVFVGDIAVFWGKHSEKDFLKTAYHKALIRRPIYKRLTIRNGNTWQKILELVSE